MTDEKAKKIAEKFAPVFVQDVAKFFIGGDQIAPIDFSGSIADVALNPKKFKKFKDKMIPDPKVYYSLCETSTHIFIIYAVYHIRDWYTKSRWSHPFAMLLKRYDEHDHDMEGALFVITKDHGDQDPLVDAVVTMAHNNFYLYSEPQVHEGWEKYRPRYPGKSIRLVKNEEDIDGRILLDKNTDRVKLFISTKGHGIYGDHRAYKRENWYHDWFYKPVEENKKPDTTIENIEPKIIDYKLENIFTENGLWAHRDNQKVFLRGKEGKYAFVEKKGKNKYKPGKANPPWSWDDQNDKSPLGEIATDPVRLITRYAGGWGTVSHNYEYNPYQNIT